MPYSPKMQAILALPLQERREAMIARLEAMGHLDPHCRGCEEQYNHYRTVWDGETVRDSAFAPHHVPSPYCQSGRRPHCTCGSCWD